MDKTIHCSELTQLTPIPKTKEDFMKMAVRLVENFYLFVPKVTSPTNLEEVKRYLVDGPVALAIRGGGHIHLAGYKIPVRSVELADLQIHSAVVVGDGQESELGITIRLPDDLARIQAAWERCVGAWDQDQVSYNWPAFFAAYRNDLGRLAGRIIQDHVMATRLDGLMAHAVSDIRLKEEEVGLAPETAKRLQRLLAREVDPKIKNLEDIDGLWVILERFPTASEAGARWCVVRILNDRPEGHVFVNPRVWQMLQGGDEDGDLAHVGQSGRFRLAPSREIGPFPNIELYESGNLLTELVPKYRPLMKEEAVDQVMGMCMKELTGLLHYTWHCITRSAAVRYALGSNESTTDTSAPSPSGRRLSGDKVPVAPTPSGRRLSGIEDSVSPKDRVRRVYSRIFDHVYFGMIETVMDARKAEGTIHLQGLTEGLKKAIGGCGLSPTYFEPFVDPNNHKVLTGALRLAGNSLRTTWDTAFGRLVAAGRRLPSQAIDLIRDLRQLEVPVDEILDRLQKDALGEQFLFINSLGMGGNLTNTPNCGPKGWNVTNEFTITRNGETVCQKISDRVDKRTGNRVVTLKLCLEGRQLVISLPLPHVQPFGQDGHTIVRFEGSDRFYRPVFALQPDREGTERVVKWDIDRYLTQVLLGEIIEISRRKSQLPIAKRLVRAIRRAVVQLPLSDPRQNLVRQSQYQVFVRENDLLKAWTERRRILTHLADQGFDVLSTSKNKPGTVVMKANSLGVPSYLLSINPFAKFLDGKRRVEPMEIHQALDLYNPKPLRVKAIEMPKSFQKAIGELTVAIFDCNLNTFSDGKGGTFCHDTLIGCPSILERMALTQLEIDCDTEVERDQIVANLLDQGYGIDSVTVHEVPEYLGTEAMITKYRVRVECRVDDIGKIKSPLGSIKGVPNVIPTQLYTVDPNGNKQPIDLVIPKDTVLRKKSLDLVFYILASKAGLEKIDPRLSLEELVELLPDCTLSEITDENGNVLGRALVGPMPFFRPKQTGLVQFRMRSGNNGIRIHLHAMIMAGVDYNTPVEAKQKFVEAINMMEEIDTAESKIPCSLPNPYTART